MDALIWSGAAMSFAGMVALIWCVVTVWRARKSGQTDDELRATMRRVVPVNTGALLFSVLGLMVVVLGIVLG